MRKRDSDSRSFTVGWILVLLAGLSVIGYGLAFMAQNLFSLAELGLQLADIGLTADQIGTLPTRFVDYIVHVQLALGGFITAVGTSICFFALGIRQRQATAWWGALAVTIAWIVLTTPPHFILGFSELTHLWVVYGNVVTFAIGAYLTRPRG